MHLACKIDAVPRAAIDPHFRNATANGLHVTWKPEGETENPHFDAGVGLRIFQAIQPFLKHWGLADLTHEYKVA